MSVGNVIKHNFCIGCGNCSHVAPKIFRINEEGFAEIVRAESDYDAKTSQDLELASKACPFSSLALDEDVLNAELFSDAINEHKAIGRFEAVYVGHDNNEELRAQSSSGGLTTYVVSELLRRRIVDAAIVVAYDEQSETGVRYSIVVDPRELVGTRQSKYLLAGYGDLLHEIAQSNKRYVFVGVPCHVKAIRLLAKVDPDINNKIKFAIAVFCGHQKSIGFRDYIAWQLGVGPGELKKLVYRVKKPGYKAHQYFYRAIDKSGGFSEAEVSKLRWMDWGIGLFKLKACDFCDDVAGEVADAIFGDAWIKPYTADYLGNNVVITRHHVLDEILNEGRARGEISLDDHSLDVVFKSQGANFRHRKEGLISRIRSFSEMGQWYPDKRGSLFANYVLNTDRDKLYVFRHKLSSESHRAFAVARRYGDLNVFFSEMAPLISTYLSLQGKTLSWKDRVKARIKRLVGA